MGISATKWSQKLKGNKQILFFILPLLKPFQGSLEFCTKHSEFPSLTTTTKTKKCIKVSKNYMNTYNHEKPVWIKLHWLWSEISLRAGHQLISPDGKELPNSSKLLWKTKPRDNFAMYRLSQLKQ